MNLSKLSFNAEFFVNLLFFSRNSMGCGEQTTSNFYANLRVYLYLSHTNAITEAATKQAREKLLLDYTRITGFFKHNGAQLWMVNKF